MTIEKNNKVTQLLDGLLKDYQKPEDILGESGLLMQFNNCLHPLVGNSSVSANSV